MNQLTDEPQCDADSQRLAENDQANVLLRTFGCRVNQYESDAMRSQLASAYRIVRSSEPADIVIVNGCTVTGLAAGKSRKAVRQAKRDHPGAIIVLIGCLAEAAEQGWGDAGEADLTASNAWKRSVADVVRYALSGWRGDLGDAPPVPLNREAIRASFPGFDGRIRGFLKIQDGCTGACTYCQTRLVRGPAHSKSVKAAAAEARTMIAAGAPELVLSGINLSEYAPSDGDLADLIRELDRLPGLKRLRLGSINPDGVTDRLLDALAEAGSACPHLHIAIQSGDDGVLRRMNRRYTTADVERRVREARSAVPGITFGTDVMVGFPGESEDAFANTCSLVERVGFINLHLFRYSRREGTAAVHLDRHLDGSIKLRRAAALESRWHEARAKWLAGRVGECRTVLAEEKKDQDWCGYSEDYVGVRLRSVLPLHSGSEVRVRITSLAEDGWGARPC